MGGVFCVELAATRAYLRLWWFVSCLLVGSLLALFLLRCTNFVGRKILLRVFLAVVSPRLPRLCLAGRGIGVEKTRSLTWYLLKPSNGGPVISCFIDFADAGRELVLTKHKDEKDRPFLLFLQVSQREFGGLT